LVRALSGGCQIAAIFVLILTVTGPLPDRGDLALLADRGGGCQIAALWASLWPAAGSRWSAALLQDPASSALWPSEEVSCSNWLVRQGISSTGLETTFFWG